MIVDDEHNPRRAHTSGGRASKVSRHRKNVGTDNFGKGPRTWKAGRKPMSYAEKGRQTSVRVPSEMYDLSLVNGGISAFIRVMWSVVTTDKEMMDKVMAESRLYYPYGGVGP